jgi:hypothetical protein
MEGLWKSFNDLIKTINKFNDISLKIQEQNRSLEEIDKKLERITAGTSGWTLPQ